MSEKYSNFMTLDYFFNPKTVAIIGASHNPGKIGYAVLENFVKGGYQGKIFPINPDNTPIFDLPVYKSLREAPAKIELAVIAVPAKFVPKVLKECVEENVKAVIIISAGFSEIGEEGKKLEDQLRKIISKKNIRVLGPNVVGVYDSSSKLDTLFLSQERLQRPKEGNISFITQSGAVGSTVIDWLADEGVGISKFISYGNALDVNETDLLEYLSQDEKTKVIIAYIEGIRAQGKKFLETMKKIAHKKPIVVLKAGKTERGTKAVASHTGSLAGSAKIYSAVFKQAGIIEAMSWEELFDYSKALSMQPLPLGDNLLIITNGGGFGVLATDEAERLNLELKELSTKLKTDLGKVLPNYVSLANPMDLVGDSTSDRYRIAIEHAVKEFDGLVVITLFQVPTLEENIVDVVIDAKKYGKPILCCATGGKFTQRLSERLELSGVPVYPTPERAVKAFAAISKYSKIQNFKKA